ncbi:MAG: cell division protein FtsX [Alphaproteobacteria bacterium]
MKKTTVFSLVREQSMFMTAIMSLLTFLSVLALGIALSIGTGVMRWNSQWELFATVQVTNPEHTDKTKKIITDNSNKIQTINEISTEQMTDLMSPWISGGSVLKNYLPKMWEIEFKSTEDMKTVGEQLSKNARFLTHASALKSSTGAGWKMILMSSFILILTLGAIGVCISYIARNTAMLHRRELEILNQIGASDNFVAHQMQIIVAKISATAAAIGFIAAIPVLLLIISTAHSARVGLMAMLGLSGTGWLTLFLLPVAIVAFSIWTTRRTTIKLLQNS